MKSNQKFSKAFYVALVATLLLTVGAIIGKFILGGNITKALLVVLPSIAALWVFMLVIRKARSSSMDADIWGVIEKVVMAFFWILMIMVPVNYAVYGFCTMFSGDRLQALAQDDAAKVEQFYSDYEDFRSTALDKAFEDIKNYIKSGDNSDAALLKFVSEKVTNTMDENQVAKWYSDADDDTKITDGVWNDFLSELNDSWGMAKFNYFAQTLDAKCRAIKGEIEGKMSQYASDQELIPSIEDNSGKYKLSGKATFDGLDNAPTHSEFADRINNVGSMLGGNVTATVFGVILGLILALAVFLFALNEKIIVVRPKKR